jgi:hypothetical protein
LRIARLCKLTADCRPEAPVIDFEVDSPDPAVGYVDSEVEVPDPVVADGDLEIAGPGFA